MAAIVALAAPSGWAEDSGASSMHVDLPRTVGGWSLQRPAKRVEPKAIFNYMDGAGELYLGYRFQFLEVFEYANPGEDEIVVEIYWMKSPDDAYGLLSGDWGGEAVDLAASSSGATVRALYGAGLLRIWSGALYARVMSYQETTASKRTVMELGKAIVAGRALSAVPRLIQALPPAVGTQLTLRPERTVYLRSHLVLNSVYFLSSENLLDLTLGCELVATTYRSTSGTGTKKPARVLLVRYPDQDVARSALAHFQRVYLAGKATLSGDRGTVAIEDGWTGFVRSGRGLALVFEASDEPLARLVLESMRQTLDNVEAAHE